MDLLHCTLLCNMSPAWASSKCLDQAVRVIVLCCTGVTVLSGSKSEEPLLALPAVTGCCASCGRCSPAGHRGYAQHRGGTAATGKQRSDCVREQVETRRTNACS